MQPPLVSVVMGTYNGAGTIMPAVLSILGQTMRDFELIILDDGSTDRTAALLESFVRARADPRIRLLERKSANQGVAQTMNALFAAARGRYIAPMDHDDIALPRRLELLAGFLEARPDLDGCGAGHVVLRSAFSNMVRVRLHAARAAYREPGDVAASTLFGGLLFNPTVCLRSRVLSMIRPWHDDALATGSDDDWFERLSAAGARFAILPQAVLLYRRHAGNLSRKHPEITRAVRSGIARRAALRIRPDAAEEELRLHTRLAVRDPRLAPGDLPALRAWFERLLAGNLDPARIGPDALRRVLALNWQRACALAACHDPCAGLRAYNAFAGLSPYADAIWPVLYQYQKRKLARIFHVRGKGGKASAP